MRQLAIVVSLSVALTGCASTLSGLDGGSQFACKAPDGVTCSSLSGVYANAIADNLPALRKAEKPEQPNNPPAKPVPKQESALVGSAPSSGDPIRTQPKQLRIWVAPWEDSEGDLHDQSYLYVMADPGRWVIEHSQKRIEERYRPTFIQAKQGGQQPKPAQAPRQNPGTGVVLPGNQSYSQTSGAPDSVSIE
ncbi:MAG: type IV conjugative transfer system lipoprotein TraV [Pseudomonadota bacterium]|nr:type IV conjugative transfer system lipoprotein TraV [Pseudomonadota bacterium]MDP1904205.1 type IV conjugative transfer system lipoprotein TraV [Pseudomonadota bacterium]